APIDPTIGATYFAQGQFVDVYRFRYTPSNFSARALVLTLANPAAQVFNQFLYNNSAWGPQATTVDAGNVSVTPLTVQVTPAPASAALLGLGGLVAARRRRIAK
ncbi:MAG TPA: PEP-CTERM sorting domain-containing protein, partial [Phycisphaerales bacterium]|nr:PEP-CTERM sorting domain-containing protein [Phycisphaerales bacterium]